MRHRDRIRRLFALLVSLLLLLSLCACGETESGPYRALAELGEKRYSLICRRGDRLAPLIDAAMYALWTDGRLSGASLRWLGQDSIALSGGDPAEALPGAQEGEEGQSVRTLIFGVERDFDPMSYESGEDLVGMSVDIGLAVAELLGMEAAFQPISPAEVATQLASGNIDCALGFDPAEVDGEKYSVGVCYLTSTMVLAARTESPVRSLADLKDLRIGTIEDPLLSNAIRDNSQITRYASGATVYLTPGRCMEALDKGWCAAVAMDRIMLERLI